eukprot:CAMPEP_0182528316 /NCGR_PEP_ID=MMETSP1323-20130603/4435_1 /TAXON_ID=236787 /ORGANISM="Florenciella parvula, Strain RCC1693" /LENGTH=204 /DNA_ID=CAMNT_0024737421 /DNA_START=27 /DNA_END=637 /DNA_ORIENTATION=+
MRPFHTHSHIPRSSFITLNSAGFESPSAGDAPYSLHMASHSPSGISPSSPAAFQSRPIAALSTWVAPFASTAKTSFATTSQNGRPCLSALSKSVRTSSGILATASSDIQSFTNADFENPSAGDAPPSLHMPSHAPSGISSSSPGIALTNRFQAALSTWVAPFAISAKRSLAIASLVIGPFSSSSAAALGSSAAAAAGAGAGAAG